MSFLLSGSWVAWRGPLVPADRHAHLAHQVFVSRDAALSDRAVVGAAGACWLVPSGASHRVVDRGPETLVLWIEPASWEGRTLTDVSSADLARALPADLWDADLAGAAARVLEICAAPARPLPPVVRRVLASLDDDPGATLADLALLAGCSPDHLTHVFTRSVGAPLRRFRTWRRLVRAARLLLSGASVTDAAIDAGFADTAHLTRTFRRFFGTTPSSIPRPDRCSVQADGTGGP